MKDGSFPGYDAFVVFKQDPHLGCSPARTFLKKKYGFKYPSTSCPPKRHHKVPWTLVYQQHVNGKNTLLEINDIYNGVLKLSYLDFL